MESASPRAEAESGGPSSDAELAIAADRAQPLQQLRAFTRWVGEGRKLTQAGHVRLADARELVALLGTRDELDGRFRITTSAELPGVATVVAWAKATRLVRVARGRLARVKKNAEILDRPLALWTRMFEAFPQLGGTVCPSGWGESLMRRHFEEVVGALLEEVYRRGGAMPMPEAYALAWSIASRRYMLDAAPEEHRRTWRSMNDRDVRYALALLEQLGALTGDDDRVALTELGWLGVRRRMGDALPGDRVLQVRISLLGVSRPPVWRRLLVPADIRLDRLHQVIQAAMGWEDYHLHVFTAGPVEYGMPDPELGHRDERKATLGSVVSGTDDRIRYTYDFGDDWEHEIVVEKVVIAEPGARYPICVAGKGRCPPEDCGGPWGYENLRAALADPGHEEHRQFLEWLGLESPSEFDPTSFDVYEVNEALGTARPVAGVSP